MIQNYYCSVSQKMNIVAAAVLFTFFCVTVLFHAPTHAVADDHSRDETPDISMSEGLDESPGLWKRFRDGKGQNRRGKRGERLNRMGKFLTFVTKFQQSVKDPRDAAGLAILGIKHSLVKQGKADEAVAYMQSVLDKTSDQKMRNIILFHMKQHYARGKHKDVAKSLAIQKQIVEENLKAIQ